jgi:glycosyltransferase involved in cell wall biosynthesis
MRVLHVIDTLGRGGAERQLLQTVRYFHRRGIAQAVLCLFQAADMATEFRQAGAEVLHLGATQSLPLLPTLLRPAILQARGWRPDIISTHLPSADIIGRSAAARLSIPAVSTWHSTLYSLDQARHLRPKVRVAARFYRQLDSMTARWGQRFIAISQTVRDSYTRALGIPISACEIVPNSLELKDITDSFPRERRYSEPLRLVHVGRHVADKGVSILLDALSTLPQDLIWRLDLLGTGPLSESLQGQARRIGIASRVFFHGSVADVLPIVSHAHILVLPSLREGQCLAYLEALAAGTPTIASDIPALREVDPAGLSTRFFPAGSASALAEAVAHLAHDEAALKTMHASARGLAQPFDLETVGPRRLALLETLAGLGPTC